MTFNAVPFVREFVWTFGWLWIISNLNSFVFFSVWTIAIFDDDDNEDETEVDVSAFSSEDAWLISADYSIVEAHWDAEVEDDFSACEFSDPIWEVDDEFFDFFLGKFVTPYDDLSLRWKRF